MKTILLNRNKNRHKKFHQFFMIHWRSSQIKSALADSKTNCRWISQEQAFTNILLRESPIDRSDEIILLHQPKLNQIPILEKLFDRVAYLTDTSVFLPQDELAHVFSSSNPRDLFIGLSIDKDANKIIIWRGDLDRLILPFSAFTTSGSGIDPDFSDASIIDFGQTIRLGQYEAATDALLYENDRDYRKRIKTELRAKDRSFGSCLRRLRKQRGLRREDFGDISSKTLSRIESGEVQHPHKKTLTEIAYRLGVSINEIADY